MKWKHRFKIILASILVAKKWLILALAPAFGFLKKFLGKSKPPELATANAAPAPPIGALPQVEPPQSRDQPRRW